ncbi:hypothetical protein DT065_01375 [Salicibibacter kimchii]|uniref:Uncharacterized protein n=1 Tax=Salicibibacter kimchii TaxID=2099786 RepID=A0A345BV18_9BACI|nr:hypothetical protein DT065_01375 [Salicibibacter kimchii]
MSKILFAFDGIGMKGGQRRTRKPRHTWLRYEKENETQQLSRRKDSIGMTKEHRSAEKPKQQPPIHRKLLMAQSN